MMEWAIYLFGSGAVFFMGIALATHSRFRS